MSINNISMYNYMNAAYLAKLTYKISLLSIIQKSLLQKSLTMRMRSRAICDWASEKGPSGHKIHHIAKWYIS